MDIVIGSEASIATPPTGYVTLFINTDQNNLLYAKYPDGSYQPYSGANNENAGCLADAWMKAVSCALNNGLINATDFEAIMNQGLSVENTSVTDDNGNTTTTLNVGSRQNAIVSIALDSNAFTIAAAGTHQIITTFNPTNASNKTLTYLSSNVAKATVSSTGLVTGVATGSATITVIPAADPSKAQVVTVTIS